MSRHASEIVTVIALDTVTKSLADLIAIPSVNPMGNPCESTAPVERGVVEYLENLFALSNVETTRQSPSDVHGSLLVSIPAASDRPALLLESHMDTVLANDWPERAFFPRTDDGTVYGRGAGDDKGCLASMVLAVLDLLESGSRAVAPSVPAGGRR